MPVESIRAVAAELVTSYRSLRASLYNATPTKIIYQDHVGAYPIDLLIGRLKTLADNVLADGRVNKRLVDEQLRHCALTLRQILLTRFELLWCSIELEHQVRYAFTELCSLLGMARDKVNKMIKNSYQGEGVIAHNDLLDTLLARRKFAIVSKITSDLSTMKDIVQQESALFRTVFAAILTVLPPTPWGDNVASYVVKEGLDSLDDCDWTNFLMPGINSPAFRKYVSMATSRLWKAVSHDLVAMDLVNGGGVSAEDFYNVATCEGLEAYTTQSCALRYIAVQLDRHEVEREQDYVMCHLSSLLLTDKCTLYGSHGSTLTAYTIVDNLLQPSCSVLSAMLQPASHAHSTNCQQANTLQITTHVLRGVASALQDCSQWYQCRLHQYINTWQLQPFLILLVADLPLLLTLIRQQLLPLVNTLLVGVAEQLQMLVNDVKAEHDRLTKECALIRENLSTYIKHFHDNLVKRYQQIWKQPIKFTGCLECAPTGITKESVQQILLPCVQACVLLPSPTQEICVTFCVTTAIECWRNSLLSSSQRYSKEHCCQLLSDFTYMVSSASCDATGLSCSMRSCINHQPVVMETREALYKLCGIYYNSNNTSCDPASHDSIITNALKTLPEGISSDQWAASMATRMKP